jgi:hypothetical protein
MYVHDISTQNPLVKFPTVQRWGKEILQLTFQFLLDCWHTRKLSEHETNGDPLHREKEKITEEIQWLMNSLADKVPTAYLQLNQESLLKLSCENLLMMAEQLSKLKPQS